MNILEERLNKLPETIKSIDKYYDLCITKYTRGDSPVWRIEYTNNNNVFFSIEHELLSICVENTLSTIEILEDKKL